ncbi:hypothetical protein [Phytoactinopolyspora endophytica]|uniref:hypothetical protein n=1 Tax=Phytoactinopolyspora endophytica TaxID=1642495 RepID=UPI00101C2E0A|nr:hypothetical protein [Phytoactinopolyspora endophytica]
MTETTISRLRAGIIALAPMVLLAALAWHPYIGGRLPNDSAVADAVAAGPTRWGLAHLAAGVASGVVVLAFLAVRSYLRERSEDRWSALGMPFVVIGSALYTLLPGMEFAPLAAVETGEDAAAAQEALEPWFLPVLLVGAFTFALGVLGFAKGVAGARILGPGMTGVVVMALVTMAASRFVPLFAVQAYVQPVAALIALWPLARLMWTRSPAPIGRTAGTSVAPG